MTSGGGMLISLKVLPVLVLCSYTTEDKGANSSISAEARLNRTTKYKRIKVTLRNGPPLMGTIPQPPAALNEFSGNCPDGSYPLKHCTPNGCPPGYYCHYDACCQHLKPGSCPWQLPNAANAGGPPCDSDIDCGYNLKCCQINGRSRCVFPYGYSGGTVGLSQSTSPTIMGPPVAGPPAMGPPVVGPPAMGPPVMGPPMYPADWGYGYADPGYAMGNPYMAGYGYPGYYDYYG